MSVRGATSSILSPAWSFRSAGHGPSREQCGCGGQPWVRSPKCSNGKVSKAKKTGRWVRAQPPERLFGALKCIFPEADTPPG